MASKFPTLPLEWRAAGRIVLLEDLRYINASFTLNGLTTVFPPLVFFVLSTAAFVSASDLVDPALRSDDPVQRLDFVGVGLVIGLACLATVAALYWLGSKTQVAQRLNVMANVDFYYGQRQELVVNPWSSIRLLPWPDRLELLGLLLFSRYRIPSPYEDLKRELIYKFFAATVLKRAPVSTWLHGLALLGAPAMVLCVAWIFQMIMAVKLHGNQALSLSSFEACLMLFGVGSVGLAQCICRRNAFFRACFEYFGQNPGAVAELD